MSKVILITGANGFLGRHLCRHFSGHGYEVRPLARKGPIYFDLKGDIDPRAFEGIIDAVIHCAWETRPRNPQRAAAVNIEGTKRLLELSRQKKVGRFVFISSFAASEEAESWYGRSKFEIEKMLDPSRDLIIRPGMIIGGGGLFQRLRESIRKRRVVPLFFGGRQRIQTVWIGDLCAAVEKALEKGLTGLLKIAEEEPIPLRAFYEGIAAAEKARCLFVPLPGAPTLFLLRLAERLGIQLPITSDNLLGLKHLQSLDVRKDLEDLGVPMRSFHESVLLV